MDYIQRYKTWIGSDIDDNTRNELIAIADDEEQIKDRFYMDLEFGTAGMRGIIGAGTNRMNVYMVRKASQALAGYIKARGNEDRGVVIAYDSRNYSSEFALETALVLCGNGVAVYLYESLRSVPQLSFSVRELKCAAGVVITASHNPPEYNGYKVYGEDGAQLTPGPASELMEAMKTIPGVSGVTRCTKEEALVSGRLKLIGHEMDEKYYEKVKSLVLNPDLIESIQDSFRIVYTPVHGSGNIPVRRVLSDIGVKHVYVVKEQELPDGNFPTVKAPNPEEADVFSLAIKLAREKGANVIIATDPDCDRLGVAVLNEDGEFIVLTGNQIGCLMLQYILEQNKAEGKLKPGDFAVRSIVSTEMADVITDDYGVQMKGVLTGFRFIAEEIESGVKRGNRFLFGFEESYGYLTGTFVRDKDACIASMLLTETAAWHASRGRTLYQGLKCLYSKYGYFKEAVVSYSLSGIEGMKKIQNAMKGLRENQPGTLCGLKVEKVLDYQSGTVTSNGVSSADESLPKSNVLYFSLESGGRFIARPSGTEPKLKTYLSIRRDDEHAAEQALQKLKADVDKLIRSYID